jgi:hypothetical protein
LVWVIIATSTSPEAHSRRLEIERQAHALKIPLGFADQFYVLREHILLVRPRLTALAAVANRDG